MNEYEALFSAEMNNLNSDKNAALRMDTEERMLTRQFIQGIMDDLDFMINRGIELFELSGAININIPTKYGIYHTSLSCQFSYKFIGKESYPSWNRDKNHLVWNPSRNTCHNREGILSLTEIVKRIAKEMC